MTDFDARRAPLRDVVHIKEWEGPRGGAYWCLRLECGHIVIRKCRRVYPHNAHLFALRGDPVLFCAPKQCRCLHCGKEG